MDKALHGIERVPGRVATPLLENRDMETTPWPSDRVLDAYFLISSMDDGEREWLFATLAMGALERLIEEA